MNGMCKNILPVSLATFFLSFASMSATANNSEPLNFYEPAPNPLLQNVEKYHLGKGVDKFRHGQYEYAWSEFAFILHYFPNHPRALEMVGNLSIQIENPERAERYFVRALKMYPHNAETHALYGDFLQKTNQIDKAIQSYKQAISLDQHFADYHYSLGLAYFSVKDYNSALQEARVAYQKGYPQTTLKDKLKSVKAWPKEIGAG